MKSGTSGRIRARAKTALGLGFATFFCAASFAGRASALWPAETTADVTQASVPLFCRSYANFEADCVKPDFAQDFGARLYSGVMVAPGVVALPAFAVTNGLMVPYSPQGQFILGKSKIKRMAIHPGAANDEEKTDLRHNLALIEIDNCAAASGGFNLFPPNFTFDDIQAATYASTVRIAGWGPKGQPGNGDRSWSVAFCAPPRSTSRR